MNISAKNDSSFPKIELFLSDIAQEFPPNLRLQRIFSWETGDWGYDWSDGNGWDDSLSPPGANEFLKPVINEKISILKTKIRHEDFGGLLFIPVTRRILKLNQLAYEMIEYIREGHKNIADKFGKANTEIISSFLMNEGIQL